MSNRHDTGRAGDSQVLGSMFRSAVCVSRTAIVWTALLAALAWMAVQPVWATPAIGILAPVSSTVARYAKYEVRVPVKGTAYTNPYDFDPSVGGAVLRAVVTAPSGAVSIVDGYYAEGYTLSNPAAGTLTPVPAENGWRIRFTPTEVGNYSYSVTFQDRSGTAQPVVGKLTSTASSDHGFVRRQTAKNYLRFDSNDPFIPVGENLCWGGNNGLGDFKTYLDKLILNRANMIRVWLCDWGIEMEWKAGTGTGYAGLKRYAQNHAFELDWLLDYCSTHGIYIELCLGNQSQVQAGPGWAANPYNSTNSGPCPTPQSFFSNATAKATYKNKLRYLVARYGYSKNLMAWELFNEIDWVDGYSAPTASPWCKEMAAYLKASDPNRHFVSVSYAVTTGDPTVWNDPNIDFTQTHTYDLRADLEKPMSDASSALRAAHNKPFLSGEFGIHWENNLTIVDDPLGTSFRTTLWASAFNGSMGPGLTWWWDEWIDPIKAYPAILHLRDFLDAHVNVVAQNYLPVAPEVRTATGQPVTVTPGYSGFQPPTYTGTKPPYSAYSIALDGTLSPAESTLGMHLFGAWHSAQRNPPTFTFNMPVAGQCQVKVAAVGSSDILVVKLDGNTLLTQVKPAANGVYSINVPAGTHSVTLDDTGNDWIQVATISVTNFLPAITGSALRDGGRLAGYLRLRNYNWQYLKAHAQTLPPAVANATLTVRNLTANARYHVAFTDVGTGAASGSSVIAASGTGVLVATLPTLSRDLAFAVSPAP